MQGREGQNAVWNSPAIGLITCDIVEFQVQIPSLIFCFFCTVMAALLWEQAVQAAHLSVSSTGTVLIYLNKLMFLDQNPVLFLDMCFNQYARN